MQKNGRDKRRIGLIGAAAVLLAMGLAVSVEMNQPGMSTAEEAEYHTGLGFSNMCAYKDKVYCGVNGAYGEPIVQESSIFTIWEDKIYYVEKVQEAYDSMTDELLTLKRSNPDGSEEKVLAEDVFLAGAGHEKLVGEKLFYGYGYDENYRMQYAWVDVNTGKRETIQSDRIDTIWGSVGREIYYSGWNRKTEENILGRINLKNGKDETILTYPSTEEEGYIDSMAFVDGKWYCLTLTKKTDGYDYRTYTYRLQIRNGADGKLEEEIPIDFTGSANYSFLVKEKEIYVAYDGKIAAVSPEDKKLRIITEMKEGEYWGIIHFAPEDGYLYYEAIAETDEETGNNDYFYRVPTEGGEAELLKAWFTM